MPTLPIWDQSDLWQEPRDRFFDAAATLGDCVAIALRDTPGTSWTNKMRLVYPNFAGLAWDDCDCGGVLQVSFGRRTSTLNFPQEFNETGQNRPTGCRAGNFMQDYTLEFIRCWPSPDDRGRPPKPEYMMTATRELSRDITAIRNAMFDCLCAMKTERKITDYIVRSSQSLGPEGSCAGWSTTFSIEEAWLGDS
jgi:hypothetical protein